MPIQDLSPVETFARRARIDPRLLQLLVKAHQMDPYTPPAEMEERKERVPRRVSVPLRTAQLGALLGAIVGTWGQLGDPVIPRIALAGLLGGTYGGGLGLVGGTLYEVIARLRQKQLERAEAQLAQLYEQIKSSASTIDKDDAKPKSEAPPDAAIVEQRPARRFPVWLAELLGTTLGSTAAAAAMYQLLNRDPIEGAVKGLIFGTGIYGVNRLAQRLEQRKKQKEALRHAAAQP